MDVVKICEVVDRCEDCPCYADDCDGRGDAEMLNEDFRPKYMQQSRHDDGKDLISRADAIAAMDERWGDIKRTNKRVAKGHEAVYLDMRATISALPSADAVHGDECDHCVYKWGTIGGDTE